ncbi:Hypothetical predicted protein [Lecanosticta acicola]|uniref:Uncharacterized protein n=1 Tax=Lecanosticta acicola TaxID=111012 RepID=A0AAI8Z5R5_9PEZI|nr:Hypothetical predicted protein [Lecanosticta acicola]
MPAFTPLGFSISHRPAELPGPATCECQLSATPDEGNTRRQYPPPRYHPPALSPQAIQDLNDILMNTSRCDDSGHVIRSKASRRHQSIDFPGFEELHTTPFANRNGAVAQSIDGSAYAVVGLHVRNMLKARDGVTEGHHDGKWLPKSSDQDPAKERPSTCRQSLHTRHGRLVSWTSLDTASEVVDQDFEDGYPRTSIVIRRR